MTIKPMTIIIIIIIMIAIDENEGNDALTFVYIPGVNGRDNDEDK